MGFCFAARAVVVGFRDAVWVGVGLLLGSAVGFWLLVWVLCGLNFVVFCLVGLVVEFVAMGWV